MTLQRNINIGTWVLTAIQSLCGILQVIFLFKAFLLHFHIKFSFTCWEQVEVMVAKCPDVLLVFEALRIIMGNISGPRSHPSEYPTLILSSPVNLNSPTYLKTQSLFITWRMWALWLLAGSEWCAWDYIRRNPELWLEGSSVRIGRMLNPSCKDWEQRVQAVAVSWGDNQQTILGGCLHCASCSPCPLEAVSLEHVFLPPQPDSSNLLLFCSPFSFPPAFAHSSHKTLFNFWIFI